MNRKINCRSLGCAALAASMVCLSACDDKLPVDGAKGNVTILARIDDGVATRTCVGNSSDDGVVGIMWSPGDRIGVYGSAGTKNAMFASTNTGAVAEAAFSGDLKAGEEPQYAYYPYSADNAAADVSALSGELKGEQTYSLSTGAIEGDYKIGTPTFASNDGTTYEFSFTHLFSLLRFDIDAAGTDLAAEGERLESIVLTAPDGKRRLYGKFTFDATNGAVIWTESGEAANVVEMKWSDKPALSNGSKYTGYITCAPVIRAGDVLKITVLTTTLKAEFTTASLVDFAANACYTFPLQLNYYKDIMEVTKRPVIKSFSFEVAKNAGNILDKRLEWNGSATRPVDVTEEALTVGSDSITGCIPYLHNFTLVPTFTVADGTVVTVSGKSQTSGVTGQDFSNPVVYTATLNGESRDYVVEVTNTGLPVAVLETDKAGGTYWTEAGINIRGKEEDWGKADYFTLYNANGSVDVERSLCSSRLRGNSTQGFPKKPFALKFDEKVGPQGLPTDKRWELLANWMDRTMLRNTVAQEVAHRTADAHTDGLGWNPRGLNVELVIDGRHVGNYYLCEKVKIDADRVAINDCYEDVVDGGNANPTVADCGYLLEFDDNYDEVDQFRTGRGLPVMFKDEVPDDIFNEVKAKVERIEANLESGNYAAAYEELDINSVIDYFLVQELTFNNEYKHPKSVYMYIDGNGPLTAGPVWDFDWQTFIIPDAVRAYGGTYLDQLREADEWLYGVSKLAENTSDWWQSPNYDYVNDMPYMWYPLLFKDETFRARVQKRWTAIHGVLAGVPDAIDKFADEVRLSDEYNHAMWPLTRDLKNNAGAGFNGDEDLTFDEAIEQMKRAYADRLEWMNGQIQAGYFVTDAE